MKFIHCADIHLDSKIEANLPTSKSRERKREILQTFLELCRFAAEQEVTAVIIAGDLFDTNTCSPVTRDAVIGEIAKAKGVDFLYLCGNHDAGRTLAEQEIPFNLKFFDEEWTSFRYGNVVISGATLTDDNCRNIYGSLCLESDVLNIVTMHGQVSKSMGEDLIHLGELANKNIDYLALGHEHTFKEGKLDKRGKWCYCGCLEGRGFDEYGQKGFVMLETDQNGINHAFVPTNGRQIEVIDCDISGLSDFSEILERIDCSTAAIPETAMVKVNLVGKVPAGARKDLLYFAKELNSRFYFAKVKDKTGLEINPEVYKNDVSLKGEFIRVAMESGLDPEQIDRILECGLSALIGMEV
ncbi:MAG: DNA repair exonuclease [Ruminococcaceae bacterium]|nr:DNA repair exonuclease [Oscillospiraceae bacterium]